MTSYNVSTIDQEGRDVLFDEVVRLVIETGKASASLIQRRLNIGYARSARLLDELEQAGIISPSNGAEPREILVPHGNKDDSNFVIQNLPQPVIKEIPKLKWKKTVDVNTDGMILELGVDEKGSVVNLDLKKYGNILLVGSQFTALSQLVNQFITRKVQEKSPDQLKLILVDGLVLQLEIPQGAPHLLTPLLRDGDKVNSALKWVLSEINRRSKEENMAETNADILVVIHGFNELVFFPDGVEEMLARIMKVGRELGIYVLLTVDYIDSRLNKSIIANNAARMVFRPTTKQMARRSGIFESIKLEKPNEAILETMFEGKKKITVKEVDTKEIFSAIFENEK
ncbi:FtsK/SpoIIIE domain-containing protein [Patescibacteria group bacterium]|nr:FtsK/SpoIIIE domain-containing protein [Patescibacteria group bacterium]